MYETLSYLPEALLNQTYEAYIAEHIFKPLNMTSSTFSVVEAEAREHSLMDSYLMRKISRSKNRTLKATVSFLNVPAKKGCGQELVVS